jgi:selenocysteine lyase/cysteine desulfurase
VIEAISHYYRTSSANTGGHFPTSRESGETVLSARRAMAAFLGAPGSEPWRTISFGWSSTTLAFSLARAFRRLWGPGDEVVITALEHETNRAPWQTLEEAGVTVREVAVRPGATLDPDDLARKITERTRLVAVGAASNAFGTVNDLETVRRLSREAGARMLVALGHVDYTRSRKRVYGFAGPAPEGAAPRCASWEVDKAEFIEITRARRIIHPDQAALLDRLVAHIAGLETLAAI